MIHRVELPLGKSTLSIETGRVATQASGAAVVRFGDTVVLVAAQRAKAREGIDFFPLTADYREKTYASGKIPGGFFKREGRPTTKEILTMRMIDRPIRPLFPPGYRDEIQISALVLSADDDFDPDVLAMIGSSVALTVSDIPFLGPLGSVRVGLVGEEFVINPTHSELDESALDLVMSGTSEAITMVECASREVPEAVMVKALEVGFEAVRKIATLQKELAARVGVTKLEVEPQSVEGTDLFREMERRFGAAMRERVQGESKQARNARIDELREQSFAEMFSEATEEDPARDALFKECFHELESRAIRSLIVDRSLRVDGRGLEDIRSIQCDIGFLPRTHGSALFTRGETQALVTTTLGTATDEQIIDGLREEYKKAFMLHYNFPPFCVGEVRPIRGPSRRDIGHGNLAERALTAVLPSQEEFPYTIRIVSDILESNGSSSMATVCGGSLALMDAGVGIRNPVAGIAMGLIKEGDQIRILTDILGEEDHCGDMDFKVAGSTRGITALQMDIKCSGLSSDVMAEALERARAARMKVLDVMNRTIERPRESISIHAPKLVLVKIPPDKIGMLIGPGGRNVRKLQEETGATIEIEDDGRVLISSVSEESVRKAKTHIERMTEEVELGKVYTGKVVDIKQFGAFVEILPGTEGLVHVSELDNKYTGSVSDVVNIGDEIQVKVILIDEQGKIKLSRKALLEPSSDAGDSGSDRPDRHGPRPRGSDRDRDRRGGGGGRSRRPRGPR